MDILGTVFHVLIGALGSMNPLISMFIVRLGLWFGLSYVLARVGFIWIRESPMLERLTPFLVFGLSTLIVFSLPLGWIRFGGSIVAYLNLLGILAIVALPREIPRIVFRRYGYQIMTTKLLYWGVAISALIQLVASKGA